MNDEILIKFSLKTQRCALRLKGNPPKIFDLKNSDIKKKKKLKKP